MHSAYRRVYASEREINSVSLMDLNANLHLTLKLEMVKVKDGSQCIVLIKEYVHVKFERVIVNCFPTIDLNTNSHVTLKLKC